MVQVNNVPPKKTAEEVTLISDVVADSPHKIFIAGISEVISSEMLMEIVTAFGSLAAYRFLFSEELNGTCAFLEYADHSITSKACAGLNGMKLGGRVITAVRVFPNPPVEIGSEAFPFYGIPDNAKSLLEQPTKVLQLKHVFDREEYMLLSKSELEETLEDVRMECARFGAVRSINVVEYPAGSNNIAENDMAEPEDISVKTKPAEFGDNLNSTEARSECFVSNQTVDVPHQPDPPKTEGVDPISESQDQKEDHLASNTALCENQAPAADLSTDLDDTQTTTAVSTSHHAEANHTEAAMANTEAVSAAATELDDNDTVENSHLNVGTSDICRPTTPGDEAEKSRDGSQEQGTNDATGDDMEKVSAVETRDGILMLEPGSVLVEFLRKEAACVAAHSLHGRLFGNRTVYCGYVPHELYLQKYPR